MLKITKNSAYTQILLLLLLYIFPLQCLGQDMPFSEISSYDIQNHFHSDEFTLITVGDKQVPIMLMQSDQVITKGVVFIIGDANMAFGRADSLTQMAGVLPALGWITVTLPSFGLSLGLDTEIPSAESNKAGPEETQAKIDALEGSQNDTTEVEQSAEAAEINSDANNSMVSTAPVKPNNREQGGGISEAELVIYSLEVAAYLESAFEHMKSTMGHRIVISQGITAATIIQLSAQGNKSTQNIDAIVVNNPYWPIRELNNKIPMIVAQTPIPMLDFIGAWDNNWSQQTQDKRKTMAKTELKEVYRQSEVFGQTFNQPQMEYMGRRFKGWISYLGW